MVMDVKWIELAQDKVQWRPMWRMCLA